MKVFIYLLFAIAAGMLIYNVTHIDVNAPLIGDSSVALVCSLTAACVIVLLSILLVSKKIQVKSSNKVN